MDLIKELGALALASRLKRLSETMMRGVTRLYEDQQVEFHPRWFPVVYLLNQEGPMPVTAIAEALGMTHPAINQTAGQLSRYGLINSRKDRKDERKRILSLSKKGRDTVARLKPLWDIIDQCGRDLIDECGSDFLGVLEKMEQELLRMDMYKRVNNHLNRQKAAECEILDYRSGLKKHFKSLNYEWLNKYFKVEEHDEKILDNPERYILKKGGQILFVRAGDEIIGTAALIRLDDKTYELAKMAVTEKWQGLGIGKKLALAAIDLARQLGARRMVLGTSVELETACHLYRALGFVETESGQMPYPGYERCTIFMEKSLDKQEKIKKG